MSQVKLIWSTPNGDNLVAYMARVSNPDNQDNTETAPNLIRYLLKNAHWSPLEMVSCCIEITTWRDIARQILRHRSFSFQEFSQRYANVDSLPELPARECRLQDVKNRQNSISANDVELAGYWSDEQEEIMTIARTAYQNAIDAGIAKEVARVLLPEGLTPSRMYMSGNLRSWVHYLQVRMGNGTQKEHAEIAHMIRDILAAEFPMIIEAAGV